MKVSVVSGGFDPIHSGHIEYFAAAKKISDHLVVLLNSDNWLKNKKGKPFMSFYERKLIIENLKMVDLVISFEDDIKEVFKPTFSIAAIIEPRLQPPTSIIPMLQIII